MQDSVLPINKKTALFNGAVLKLSFTRLLSLELVKYYFIKVT
jgi:hypothetical protein